MKTNIRIMPCLDMQNGRVVKGVHFVDIQDAGDPVACARAYCAAGADELAMLDITATVENRATMLEVVKRVAAVTTIPFTVGGGIKDAASAAAVIGAGATKVSTSSAAFRRPEVIPDMIRELGVDRITYAGVSSGGTLGVFLAAKRPDLVERLVLSNSPADTVSNSHQVYPPRFAEAQRQAREAGGFRSQFFWDQFLDYYAGDPSRFDRDIREQYYDINRRQPEPHFYALTAVVADQPRAKAAMAAVRAPTLLVWGARDALLVPAAADALASYLTGTQVSTLMLPDVGHYPPLETPARFAQLVLAFVEAATPQSQPTAARN